MKEAVDGIFKFLTRLCSPLIMQMLSNGSFLPLKQILVLHCGFSYVLFRMCGTELILPQLACNKRIFLRDFFVSLPPIIHTHTPYPTWALRHNYFIYSLFRRKERRMYQAELKGRTCAMDRNLSLDDAGNFWSFLWYQGEIQFSNGIMYIRSDRNVSMKQLFVYNVSF